MGQRISGEQELWFAMGRGWSFPDAAEAIDFLKHFEQTAEKTPFRPRVWRALPFDTSTRAFPDSGWILPRIQLFWKDGQAWSFASAPEAAEDLLKLKQSIAGGTDTPREPASLTEANKPLTHEQWRSAVRTILEKIQAGECRKAVLSRQKKYAAASSFQPHSIFKRLLESAPDCSAFSIRLAKDHYFMGASPETLFRLEDRQVTVDSLAGTRSGSAAEQELLESAKELNEQNIVTRFIEEQLKSVCGVLQTSGPARIRRAGNLQHLYSAVRGTLHEDATADDLLRLLHPTPAVCGLPVDTARELIKKLEPEPRGLYTGAIGWMDAQNAEFTVAIRSLKLEGRTATLFGGAGIVPGSDPDSEYTECELKMEPARQALIPHDD